MFFRKTGFPKSYPRQRGVQTFGALSCLLLSACAGGDSGSMSGGTPQTPPAAPATTLAQQPPGTVFPLAAHSGTEAVSVTTSNLSGIVRGTAIAESSSQVAVTANGFALTLPNGDQAAFDTSAASGQRLAPNVYRSVVRPGPQSTVLDFQQAAALTYSTFGAWDERLVPTIPGADPGPTSVSLGRAMSGGVIAYGVKTQGMPTSGSATFTGTASGFYLIDVSSGMFSANARLVANFQTGGIAGAITNITTSIGRASDLYLTSGAITGAGFTGGIAAGTNASSAYVDLSGVTGSFGGQFNGPNAAEASGTFTAASPGPGSSGPVLLIGGFAATGASTPAGQPTPTPPAPPVTLAGAPTGTSFAAGNHYGLESLTITGSATGAPTAQLPANSVTLAAGVTTAADGFTLTLPDGGAAAFKTAAGSPGPAGATLFSAAISTAANGARTARFMAGPTLTYAAYGAWDELTTDAATGVPGTSRTGAIAAGVIVYGIETAKLPTSGSATYSGAVYGHYFLPGDSGALTGGTARLVADFTTSSIAGGVTNLTGQSALGSGTRSLSDIIFTGEFTHGSSFSGIAAGGANVAGGDLSTATGQVNGAFYGPNAAEAAGAFTLADPGLGIAVAGAFGSAGAVTPAGQPVPSVPARPTLDSSTTLAALPAGFSFDGPSILHGLELPVPVVSGPTIAPGLTRVAETAAGPAFQFSGYGYATLDASTKGTLGYFGAFKDASGAPAGMIHLAENPLTYSSYGAWSWSADTSPAALPGLERTASAAGVFAYGNPTPLAQIPTSGAATYTGTAAGHFSTEPTGFGAVTGGVLTLAADFDRGSLSGAITNLTAIRANAAPGVTDRLNDIALQQSLFKGAANFYGTAAAVPTAGATIDLGRPQGNYSGQFYGPNAAEIAGSLYMNDSHNFVQLGFAGKK